MGHEIEFARINFRPELIPLILPTFTTRSGLKSSAYEGMVINARKCNLPITYRHTDLQLEPNGITQVLKMSNTTLRQTFNLTAFECPNVVYESIVCHFSPELSFRCF